MHRFTPAAAFGTHPFAGSVTTRSPTRSTSPVVTDHPGYDEAAGTEKVSSGFTRSVPVLRLSASGRSKRHFWGGTRGKEPNTDSLYNEHTRKVIPMH